MVVGPGYNLSMSEWVEALEVTRRRFEPRRLAAWGRWGVARPRWKSEDPLLATYDHHPRLFAEGRVVWARFVIANGALFEPGEGPCGALLLYGLDPALDATPEVLDRAVAACHRLRDEAPPDEPGPVRDLALLLQDDFARKLGQAVPPAVAGVEGLVLQSTIVHREHIPTGVLRDVLRVPLLVDPATGASLVLPCEYWHERLVRAWTRGGA